MVKIKNIFTPITDDVVKDLTVGDMITISGYIYAGRDAALPKLVALINENELVESDIDLCGSVMFHTAVSPAGVGPTSSNKKDIESSISALSQAGVKLHLGKGSLSMETVDTLQTYNSVYAAMPPVTALLSSKILEQTVAAFPEEGMEALHLLRVDGFPAIIVAAHGKTLY